MDCSRSGGLATTTSGLSDSASCFASVRRIDAFNSNKVGSCDELDSRSRCSNVRRSAAINLGR